MLEAKYSILMALRALILCALLGVANAKFWLEDIGHHGISPYHPSGAAYQIFRNVKDFGAIGDGGIPYTRTLVCEPFMINQRYSHR